MKRVVEAVRAWLHARARLRVLVLGDSHVRVFEHWLFLVGLPRTAFDIVYVAGGTATGVRNLKSISGAYRRFRDSLENSLHDVVLVNLGEVDTAYTIWKRADREGTSVDMMLDTAVRNYTGFIQEVSAAHRVIVLSAPLPTLTDQAINPDPEVTMRQEVSASQLDRTRLALRGGEGVLHLQAVDERFVGVAERVVGGVRVGQFRVALVAYGDASAAEDRGPVRVYFLKCVCTYRSDGPE